MKGFLKFVIIISVFGLIGYACLYRNLTGVFSSDTKFREKTEYIIVHHDAVCRDCSIKEIDLFHKEVRGWDSGFAYHYYISGGKINQVHCADAVLPNAIGYNRNAVAVCLHTDDKGEIINQIELITLIKILMIKYNIPKDRVKGHCEVNSCTQCPEIDLESLRKWL